MIKFYLKVILKSPIFIISMIFNIFIMIVQITALNSSIHLYARINFYGYISFNLFLILVSTYIMSKKYEVSEFLENNLFKKYINIFFTNIVISSLVFLLPMVVIIIYTWNKISFVDFYQGILNYFILWILSNSLAALIGCTIGMFIRKWYSYIISIIIYIGYMSIIYGPSKSNLYKLFCVFSDNIFINENRLAPVLFNINYYLDKFFIILFILLIIDIAYLFLDTNTKKNYIFSIISFFCIIFLMIIIIIKTNTLSKIGVEVYDDFSTKNYIIKNYKMNLELKSDFKNLCELDLKFINNTDELILMLDNTFSIESILIDSKEVEFEHNNNKVTIHSNFKKDQNIKIKFNYNAFIDISNYLGVNTYYVNNRYINLPHKKFFWYPTLNNNKITNFDISLISNTKIYSNLDTKNNYKNNYNLEGSSYGVNIFAGNYQTINYNNILYIIPKGYKIENLESYLNSLSKRLIEKNSSSDNIEKSNIIKNKTYKKVLFGEWYSNSIENDLGNEILFYDNTIIINLGV